MNYQDFVLKHRKTGADITVAALPSNEKNAQAFGLMKIDDNGRIIDFAEKPKGDALRAMRVDTTILGLDAERCAARHRKLHKMPQQGNTNCIAVAEGSRPCSAPSFDLSVNRHIRTDRICSTGLRVA